MKEYKINMKATLIDDKEYWTHDNSGLVCATALQELLSVYAKNFGLKSPEKFGILSCKRLMNRYHQIRNMSLYIEEFPWSRISYDGINFHNHAFVGKSEGVRTCTIQINRKGTELKPKVPH